MIIFKKLDFMKTFFFENSKIFPLVVSPDVDSSKEDLMQWINKTNRILNKIIARIYF